VIVIGYDEWLRRFDADPNIVGRTVRLGGTTHTIVGVMPEGFGFPVNHTFWIPWRIDPGVYQPLTGPGVTVFGRLAPGATLETANAELVEFGRRAAADSPRTHEHLRPLVIPYTYAYNDMGDPENQLAMRAIQASLTMVLILVCINVSILVYARTATRQGEIAVRGALGASRRRIVAQLFVEALVLAGVAAAIGVFMISIAMPLLEAQKNGLMGRTMPFWMHLRISNEVVIDIVLLTLVAATIVGVLPALKATGVNVQGRLQTLSDGGGSRMQMGPLWTLLIVAQVAATVTVLPAALFFTWESLRVRSDGAGFASREVLSASLTLERSSAPATAADDTTFRLRFATQHAQLDDAWRANPAVVDVTFSMESPGRERAMALEAEDQALPQEPVDYNITEGSKAGHLARYNRVATNFFDAYGIPLLLGRGFTRADLGTDHVIINRTLANVIFGGERPLGRRIKYVGRSREAMSDAMPLDRWFEIIGVVPDFPADEFVPDPILYHPAAHGDVLPARIGIRTRGSDPATYSSTVRDIAAAVNPDLQLRDMTTSEMAAQQELGMFRIIGVTVGLVMTSVIILSAAGIYALMSFTVAKRRREIGIRAALGADRNRLLAGIFSRALGQLAIGAAIGMVGAFGVAQALEGELLHGQGAMILPVVALVMIVVGVLASIGPARQGLSIHPIEALRDE
jgi:predicted permease